MDAQQLQSFVMVLEVGSMSDAAKKLGVTPAAIAARVRGLEDELGVPLLKRSGRFVKPTLAGVNIAERSRRLLREMRDLRVAVNNTDSFGELRLGVFQSAMISLLPSILRETYEKNPDLNIIVTCEPSVDLCRKIENGALDVAIVVEPQYTISKGCQWRALVAEPLVLVVHEDLAGQDAHVLLRTMPYIRHDPTPLAGQLAERYLRDHGIQPRDRLELNAVMPIAALVEQKLGISLLPDWKPMWRAGLLIAKIELPHRAPARNVGLMWSVNGPRAALANRFYHAAKTAIG
jgi:DNA-binding transcriptional LysR family regulator